MKYIVNKSFYNKIDQLEESIDDLFRETLQEVAITATNGSPVSTGAFVTSWSYIVGAGRPRGKSSEGRPRVGQFGADTMREQGYQNLMGDVAKIDFEKMSGSLTLSNGAPHAEIVDSREGISVVLENLYG